MKRRDALLALSGLMAVVFALLAVFAIELANTQAKNKRDVESRVHERAVLAGALIDGLFQTVSQTSQEVKAYSAPVVTQATLDAHKSNNAFLALYSSTGKLLVATTGFNAEANASVTRSGALGLVERGDPYGLGNVEPYGRGEAEPYAVMLHTPYGERTLVSGIPPQALSTFLSGDLREIPGVRGARNYLIDGDLRVLASTYAPRPAGYVFTGAAAKVALSRSSGDVKGRFYDNVRLHNSTWLVALSAPNGPLFAAVSGLRKWIPWAIFLAFAITALAVLALLRRLLSAADALRSAKSRSEALNLQLAATNQELEQRATELLRSNADLEHFASIASHDLQEPLRKVRTYTERLAEMEADQLSEKGLDYLRRANNSAERMQQLIEDLLRYSRVATQGREFAPVDLGALLHEVIDDLGAQVERTAAHIEVGDLPTVMGDEPQLRQLLQNLLSNAMKFHREGVAPHITVRGEVTRAGTKVTITDNGIGFDPRYRQRIFRIFERLNGRSEYPGTGIGLALCRKIAERHGGEMFADGTLGEGSTFTVTFPAVPPAPVGVTGPAAPGREVTYVG